MKFSVVIIQIALLVITSKAVAQKLPDPILLWPNGAPGATGNSDEDKPAIIPFVPEASKRNGTAVNMDANAASLVQPAPIWPSEPGSTTMVAEMLVSGTRVCGWK